MREYAKKLLLHGRMILCFSALCCLLFFCTVFMEGVMPTGLQGFFILIFVLCALVSMFVYYIRYRAFAKCMKFLKQDGIERFLDDIDLQRPISPKAKIYCGKNAFFCKGTYLVVPYSQVAWIYSSEGSTEAYVFCLKNSMKVEVKISQSDLRNLINIYISDKNPELLFGETRHNNREYHSKYSQPTIGYMRRGFVFMGFAALLLAVGLINDTLNAENSILIFIIFAVGIGFFVYGKFNETLLAYKNKLLDKLYESAAVNFVVKLLSVINLLSVVGIICFGILDIQSLGMICFAAYFLTVIPFVASVFLKLGFFIKKPEGIFVLPNEELDDFSYLLRTQVKKIDSFYCYSFHVSGRYGWHYMLSSVDYMTAAEIEELVSVKVGDMGSTLDVTAAYHANGKDCSKTPELRRENGKIILSGFSKCLREPIQLIWVNQTNVIQLLLPMEDQDLAERYMETVIRRSFGTKDALKRAKQVPQPKQPVTIVDGMIQIDSSALFDWKKNRSDSQPYELRSVILLKERDPVIPVYEDGVKTREYCLQTEGEEDHTGKYFHISVRAGIQGNPAVPVLQIDGFISDTEQERSMKIGDVGYRMEGQYLACGGEVSKQRYEMIRGQDLVAKGLKYPGYTTPSNVRLIGICPDCGKSFAFRGYAFYMMQADVAYSDDGLDCCVIYDYNIDKNTWLCEIDGKIFRYYNSFACPHCGIPYIDYKKYRENKGFGVSGCVHLGRKYYEEK